MTDSEEIIKKAVEYIKDKISPDKIYLFGSYARGTFGPDSDLDFFIIKQTNSPKHKRTIPLYSLDKTKTIGFPIGMDFIVYTPEEFELKKNEQNSIVGEVLRSGKVLYEKR